MVWLLCVSLWIWFYVAHNAIFIRACLIRRSARTCRHNAHNVQPFPLHRTENGKPFFFFDFSHFVVLIVSLLNFISQNFTNCNYCQKWVISSWHIRFSSLLMMIHFWLKIIEPFSVPWCSHLISSGIPIQRRI